MRRREFLGFVGGIAAAWPSAVRAQPPERMRRVRVLMTQSENDQGGRARFGILVQRLTELGWTQCGHRPLHDTDLTRYPDRT